MAEDTRSLLNIDKNLADLNTISFKRLVEEGLATSAGRIAKLIITLMNENVADFYTTLKAVHAQAFLSTSSGPALDLLGALLNCTREGGELDEDYKFRISQQTLSLAKANETAVRLACLSVEGVEDVVIRPYTHGTGSFSVYVVTDSAIVPEEVMSAVQAKVDEFKSYGVKAKVFNPKLLPVEIKIRIFFDKKVPEIDRQTVIKGAQDIAKEYINSRNVADEMNPHHIRNEIMVSSDGIFDVKVYHLRVKNRPVLVEIQDAIWNERFVEAPVPDAILVS